MKTKTILAMMFFGGLMAAGVLTAEKAYADPMTVTETNYVVNNGQEICREIAQNPTDSQIEFFGTFLMAQGFSAESSAKIVVFSVNNYCPSYMDVVSHYGKSTTRSRSMV